MLHHKSATYCVRSRGLEGLEIRLEEGGKAPTLRGYAALFNSEAHNEVIRSGAFKKSLEAETNIRALWNHDTSLPLASTGNGTLRLEEDKKGLRFEMEPDLETSSGRDAVQNIRSGLVSQMSFGFDVKQQKLTERSGENEPRDILRELLEIELYEVSPVTFPWYEDTQVGVRAIRLLEERGINVMDFATAVEANSAEWIQRALGALGEGPEAPSISDSGPDDIVTKAGILARKAQIAAYEDLTK